MAKEEVGIEIELENKYKPFADLLMAANIPEDETLDEFGFVGDDQRIEAFRKLQQEGYDLKNVGLKIETVGKKGLEKVIPIPEKKEDLDEFVNGLKSMRKMGEDERDGVLKIWLEKLKPIVEVSAETEPADSDGSMVQNVAEAITDKEKRRTDYFATGLVNDLRIFYGPKGVDKKEATEKLSGLNIGTLSKAEGKKDYKSGMETVKILDSFEEVGFRYPKGWKFASENLKKINVDPQEYEKAVQEKNVWKEQYATADLEGMIFYPEIGRDLWYSLSIKDNAPEKDLNMRKEAMRRVVRVIPQMERVYSEDFKTKYAFMIMWASKALKEEPLGADNPWLTREAALMFLRSELGVDRRVKKSTETKVIRAKDKGYPKIQTETRLEQKTTTQVEKSWSDDQSIQILAEKANTEVWNKLKTQIDQMESGERKQGWIRNLKRTADLWQNETKRTNLQTQWEMSKRLLVSLGIEV